MVYWLTYFSLMEWNYIGRISGHQFVVNGRKNVRLRCGFSKYYYIGPNFSTLNINAINLQLMAWHAEQYVDKWQVYISAPGSGIGDSEYILCLQYYIMKFFVYSKLERIMQWIAMYLLSRVYNEHFAIFTLLCVCPSFHPFVHLINSSYLCCISRYVNICILHA